MEEKLKNDNRDITAPRKAWQWATGHGPFPKIEKGVKGHKLINEINNKS